MTMKNLKSELLIQNAVITQCQALFGRVNQVHLFWIDEVCLHVIF